MRRPMISIPTVLTRISFTSPCGPIAAMIFASTVRMANRYAAKPAINSTINAATTTSGHRLPGVFVCKLMNASVVCEGGQDKSAE